MNLKQVIDIGMARDSATSASRGKLLEVFSGISHEDMLVCFTTARETTKPFVAQPREAELISVSR